MTFQAFTDYRESHEMTFEQPHKYGSLFVVKCGLVPRIWAFRILRNLCGTRFVQKNKEV